MNTFMSPTKQHIIHGELTPLEKILKNKKKVTNSTVKMSNFMLEQKSYIDPKDKKKSMTNAERQAKIAKLVNQKKTVMQKLKFGGKQKTRKQKRKSRAIKYTRKH